MSQRRPQIRQVTIANSILLPVVVDMLNEGHTVTLRLRGISMRPFLEDNRDCGLLIKCTEPRVGLPVLAEITPGHFVFHRIVRIEGDVAPLRGDGNIGTEQCRLCDVKGEAIGFYRKGRKKLDSIDGWKWRSYSWVWTRTLPLRRYMLAVDRRLRRISSRKNTENN